MVLPFHPQRSFFPVAQTWPGRPGPSGCQAMGALALLAVAALAGCRPREEEITRYYVEKPQEARRSAHPVPGPAAGARRQGPLRLLGAIVFRGSQCWFFKVIGPASAVGDHAERFQAFVRSIHFAAGEEGEPSWTLPEGWQQRPGSGLRLASIQLDPDNPNLELSVIPLAFGGDDQDAYVLSNVNRWRQQVGRDPIAAEQLADATTRVPVGGGTAIVVDVAGESAAGVGP